MGTEALTPAPLPKGEGRYSEALTLIGRHGEITEALTLTLSRKERGLFFLRRLAHQRRLIELVVERFQADAEVFGSFRLVAGVAIERGVNRLHLQIAEIHRRWCGSGWWDCGADRRETVAANGWRFGA